MKSVLTVLWLKSTTGISWKGMPWSAKGCQGYGGAWMHVYLQCLMVEIVMASFPWRGPSFEVVLTLHWILHTFSILDWRGKFFSTFCSTNFRSNFGKCQKPTAYIQTDLHLRCTYNPSPTKSWFWLETEKCQGFEPFLSRNLPLSTE